MSASRPDAVDDAGRHGPRTACAYRIETSPDGNELTVVFDEATGRADDAPAPADPASLPAPRGRLGRGCVIVDAGPQPLHPGCSSAARAPGCRPCARTPQPGAQARRAGPRRSGRRQQRGSRPRLGRPACTPPAWHRNGSLASDQPRLPGRRPARGAPHVCRDQRAEHRHRPDDSRDRRRRAARRAVGPGARYHPARQPTWLLRSTARSCASRR